LIPDRLWTAGFRASQMIYDDRTISDFRSSSRLYESSQFRYQSDRLDLFRAAGSAFFNLALADVLYRIQLSYLRLTEENLELARFREQVGYSGRDEVYRWESEVAQQRSALFERLADFESSRIALSQILAVIQGTRWDVESTEIDPDAFPFLEGRFSSLLNTTSTVDRFRLFSVGLAIQNAPELASVSKTAEAQEIQLGQRKRAWFLPSFFIDAAWLYQIDRDPELSGVDRSLPRLSIGATYPVFVGASRSYEVSQNRAALERLERERRLTHDLIERQTRTAIRRMEGSFPSIRFERLAAEAARLNFDLVQDKYAQGLVNVTDLTQAQAQSFVAAQGAAAAEFAFLLDLVDYQRAISWFEADKTVEERQELAAQIQRALGP
jgi:outer membrane protein TolC